MDLKCLFWNTARKTIDDEIVSLALLYKVNLVALAEYAGDYLCLLRKFNDNGLDFYFTPIIGTEVVYIFSAFKDCCFIPGPENERYTFKELRVPGSIPLIMGFIHLPSKLYCDSNDQTHIAANLKYEIEYAEQTFGHKNTIVCGDFNMGPFENGMVSASALNSLPCMHMASKGSRKYRGEDYSFFYNPMWNLLGDFNGPPGTYYYKSPNILSHYWWLYDQVILRPEIAKRLDRQSLSIISNGKDKSLLDAQGRPNSKVSDHLPICFLIKLDEEGDY